MLQQVLSLEFRGEAQTEVTLPQFPQEHGVGETVDAIG
jgi:hypothetical protein